MTTYSIYKRRIILFLMLLIATGIKSQVTIGTGEQPLAGTLLQVKGISNVADSTSNAYRGIAFPRVTLSEKNELYPMFLKDPLDPASGANDEYTANKPALDKSHTGLVVYNLVEDSEKDLCAGLNQWNGRAWSCFQEKMGQAVGYIVDCNSATAYGEYKNTEALNSANYLTVTLNITKVGSYTIIAKAGYNGNPAVDNSYYFVDSGMFLSPGEYTIQLSGSGRPLNYTPMGDNGDIITISMNNKPLTLSDGSSCPLHIKVQDANLRVAYSMDCNRTTVNGVYVLNKPLDINNTITVYITTDNDPLVDGAVCVLRTDLVDGISFASQPTILSSNQTIPVTLYGSGTPTSVDRKRLTITSNSTTNVSTCNVHVPISYTAKKILGIKGAGGANDYGYGLGYWAGSYDNMSNIYGLGARKMIMAPTNFGLNLNSTVRVESIEFIDGGNDPSAATLKSLIETHKPDIITIGYSYAPGNDQIDELIRYMEKRGVIIAAIENTSGVQRLFERTLNLPSGSISVESRGNSGSIYKFSYMTNDEILNGPFGDIREKEWGEDASTTRSVSGVPLGMVDIYSNGNCFSSNLGTAGQTNGANQITICRFKDQHLIFIGDGGFWSRAIASGSLSSNTICPLYYNDDFSPKADLFGDAKTTNVYNSFFFANMMAWAIKTAQFDGYNTPR